MLAKHGCDVTGADAVYIDVIAAPLRSQGLRQMHYRRLGRIVRAVGAGDVSRDRTNVDDFPLHRSLLDHLSHFRLSAQPSACEVDRDHLVPVRFLIVLVEPRAKDTRVVHRDVEPTELLHDRIDHRVHLLRTGHIARNEYRITSEPPGCGNDLVALRFVDIDDRDIYSRTRKSECA